MPAAAVALAPVAAPAADPSPAPSCVTHNRSGGYRAHVTPHAMRRFADRVLGLDTVLDGLDDREAMDAVKGFGYPIGDIEHWLAFYGYPGPRYGAAGVTVGRVDLVLSGDRVVTVIMRGH